MEAIKLHGISEYSIMALLNKLLEKQIAKHYPLESIEIFLLHTFTCSSQ